MSNKLELKKLILETKDGKKKIELTVEEAREVYRQLDPLFGVNSGTVTVYPTNPIIIGRNIWPYPYYTPPTWCGSTATIMSDNIKVSYCCSEVNE